MERFHHRLDRNGDIVDLVHEVVDREALWLEVESEGVENNFKIILEPFSLDEIIQHGRVLRNAEVSWDVEQNQLVWDTFSSLLKEARHLIGLVTHVGLSDDLRVEENLLHVISVCRFL